MTATSGLRVQRDLGSDELWERSLGRSRERRQGGAHRSLVSEALLDLDGPVLYQLARRSRDLTDPEVWDISQSWARAKRLAAEPRVLPQVRVAGATTLVVAAAAAALPVQGGAAGRARSSGTAEVRVELLRLGDRGIAVAKVQRALGIEADGIFGPRTRAAVRAFQKRHGLQADGVVGPKTRAALAREQQQPAGKLIRAWWVAPVQRALGVPADGVYGPVSRAAVRAFQKKRGLVVDGVVGPQTLGALGISRAQKPAPQAKPKPKPKPAAPAASSRGERVVNVAKRYLGTPYRWGGESPGGFDCSGFVQYVFSRVGISLPRVVSAQYRVGRPVARNALRPGDIVFFSGLGHDGIYVGGGRFIHSPQRGDVVKVSSLSDGWYASRWVGARRVA